MNITTSQKVSFFLCLCFLLVSFSNGLHASERHALIISNSAYASKSLLNPRNDAIDMEIQLRTMGYKIYGGAPAFDLDRVGIERTIRAFAHSLPDGAQALFYYAGHGVSTDEDNYLVPINHNLQFVEQLPDRAVGLRSLVELMKNSNANGMNVLLLDACRDSPLESSYRSNRQGLQRLSDIPRGVFIGYAADTGQVAEDGVGRNGTYTAELLQVMQEMPDVIIEIAHKEVANRVFKKTDGMQFPVSENKVYGDWCFGVCTDSLDLGSTANIESSAEPAQIAPAAKSGKPSWKAVGGIALGVLAVGFLLQDKDDMSTEPRSFQLTVTPPTQLEKE